METTAIFFANIKEVLQSLQDLFIVKILCSWALIFIAFMVGAQHLPLVGTLTVLVAIDLVTGLYAAYKTGEPIESKKMVKTGVKWTLYMLMISASHLTEALIPGDWFLAEVTIAFLGATELISILENIGKTGVAIPMKILNKLEQFRHNQ